MRRSQRAVLIAGKDASDEAELILRRGLATCPRH